MKPYCFFILSLLFFSLVYADKKPKSTNNIVRLNPTDDDAIIIEKAARVLPTQRQYEWQKMEFTAFLHFGMNTFTAREWGTGKESVEQFNPTSIDISQWIEVIKSAGMKMAMLTIKHHDGFCLWQTETTPHSVKNSPWKSGKGDVLGELVTAAHTENIKIGVYLSPADLHEIERVGGTYGNGSSPKLTKIPSYPALQAKANTIYTYELDDYNALFMNQLYEVLTQYGEIAEVWFDGANPKGDTGQTYNYKAWYELIRSLQPNAVIAIKGPDVRWVGNEAGDSRQNEWSVLPLKVAPEDSHWEDRLGKDLGSREKLKGAKYLYWYPAETDIPIRHGWFYRDEKQYIRTVDELLDIWYRSVGNNSVLLLNLSPNREGRIPREDALRIKKMGTIIKKSFEKNLLDKAEIFASETEKGTDVYAILNSELTSSWKPNDKTSLASLFFTTAEEIEFNRLVLQENIKKYGQRIERFTLEIWNNGRWKQIYEGGTVGYKKIVRFSNQKSQKLRLNITQSRVCPTLGFVGLYKAEERLTTPQIERNKEGIVSITCNTIDPVVHYTIDGTLPTPTSKIYKEPFSLPKGGVVKAIAVISNGKQSDIATEEFDYSAKKWKVIAVSSSAKNYAGGNVIDGDKTTLWHTPWGENAPTFPHSITIDLGEILRVKGLTYLPRQDNNTAGICTKYSIEASEDGKNWKLLSSGSFANIENNPVKQQIIFPTEELRFIRFIALEAVGKASFLSVAELGIVTR